MIEKQMKLAPLTASQSRDILALKSAYGSFWRDPRFTKGYVEPRFHRSDVEPYLSKAAEYVVRIRSHLDSLTDVPPQEKKRVISGFANEFLFNQELFSPEKGRKSGDYSHPSDDPKKFVRDLVHSTLMDTHGYVEGLDEPTVDDLISQIDTYLQESQHSSDLSDGHLLFDSLVSRWDRNAQLFSMAFGDASENQQLFSDLSTINEMKTLEALLSQTEETLRAIRLNRLRITRSPFLDAPGTPFPTHTSIQDHLQPPEASVRDDGDHDHDYRDEQRLSLQSDDCHHNVETSSSTLPESAESAQEPDSSSACRDDEGSTIDSAAPEAPSHPTLTEPSTASPEAESSPSDASSPTSSSVVDDEHAQNEGDTKQDETVDDDSADLKASYIQIQKVAEHVDQVASEFKDVLIHVEPLCSDTNALEQHPIESLKSIEKFHSTLIGYNEELLQDLIRLDDIEVDPVVRQERKKQVVAIQSLMDDLDAISSKLKKLKDVLKPQVDRIRAEQSPSPEAPSSPAASPPSASRTESPNHHHAPGRDASASPPPQSSSPKAHPSSSSSSPSSSTSSDSPLTSLWHKMKMELQWDKSQTADAYIIRTMIPGLDTKHTKIELAEDNSAFSISGLRVPTQREEAELRRSLRMRYRYPPSEEDRLLMQLVAGKYGSFKSTFGLPKDAIVDRISASYERGILQVTVPRRPIPQHVPTYFQPRAQSSRRAPNPRGFWGDRDLWWQ